MRAKARVLLEHFEHTPNMVGSVSKERSRRAVQRDVKMDAAFRGLRGAGFRGLAQGDIQILEAPEGAIGSSLDHLIKINLIRKSSQGFAGLRAGADFQGGAEVDFTELDLVLPQTIEGLTCLFKFHGEMAGIIVDAEMLLEPRIVGMLLPQLLEEADDLRSGFQVAEREEHPNDP